MNVVEFHTWNSKVARIDQPDRFVLDLDPGEGVTWPMLQEAAQLTRVMLAELGLECWLGEHHAGELRGLLKHRPGDTRSEEHTSELQSQSNLVCRLLLEKKKK